MGTFFLFLVLVLFSGEAVRGDMGLPCWDDCADGGGCVAAGGVAITVGSLPEVCGPLRFVS